LKVRRPWPVRRNPVYAIVTVHKIARTFIGHSHPDGIQAVIVLQNSSCRGNFFLPHLSKYRPITHRHGSERNRPACNI
jgi:hypothetical protein